MRNDMNLGVFTFVLLALNGNAYGAMATENNKQPAEHAENKSIIDKDVIAGNWKQLKGKIQQKWAKLTNDDVLKMKGTATELEGILQEKYGYTKEKAKESMQEFLEENKAYLLQDDKK